MEMVNLHGSSDIQKQARLEEQVQTLLGQVHALEAKLGDLHGTDVSSLRRAYKTLAQHVQALDVESKHLPVLLDRASEASVDPDFVAKQASLVAAVTAVVYGVGRLLRALHIPEAGSISAGLALLGFCYAGVRLVASTVQRLGAVGARRRRAQAELRNDLRAVRERVEVMMELVDSGLRLHRLHPSQQALLLQQQPEQQHQQPVAAPPQQQQQLRQVRLSASGAVSQGQVSDDFGWGPPQPSQSAAAGPIPMSGPG